MKIVLIIAAALLGILCVAVFIVAWLADRLILEVIEFFEGKER